MAFDAAGPILELTTTMHLAFAFTFAILAVAESGPRALTPINSKHVTWTDRRLTGKRSVKKMIASRPFARVQLHS